MATLVLVDARQGSLDRYEIGGSTYRKTHAATLDGAFHFTPKMVEDFRLMPDARFAHRVFLAIFSNRIGQRTLVFWALGCRMGVAFSAAIPIPSIGNRLILGMISATSRAAVPQTLSRRFRSQALQSVPIMGRLSKLPSPAIDPKQKAFGMGLVILPRSWPA